MVGMRLFKTVNGVETLYYWDDGVLLGERTGDNFIQYIYDADGIAGMRYNGAHYYFEKNLFGDVLRVYSVYGSVVATFKYDSYGNITSSSGSMADKVKFRYRGYYYDDETGFYYLQSRYYDPSLCCFISADQYELVGMLSQTLGQINLYAYCGNNPIMYIDETGMSWSSFWANVGNWFASHWVELTIGTAFILGGAIVTALTCGAGTSAWAAFGASLLSSTIQVGIGVAVGVGVNGINNLIENKDFFTGVGDAIASSYMWGGIFAGGAQIIGGGFRIAANAGVQTGRNGGIALGRTGMKVLSADKNSWTKAGGTLVKLGKYFRLDVGANWGLHIHILSSSHIPIGILFAGIIGGI